MVMSAQSDKRERLIAAARDLFHHHGYNGTSLADVAALSGVPIGNIYYYFKTKQQLAEAVVDRRLQEVESMLLAADGESTPTHRLRALLRQHTAGADELARYGCPFSCLAQEFERMGGPLGRRSARLLERQRTWMTGQFVELGYEHPRSEDLSLELLSAFHGAMVVGQSFRSADVIRIRFAALEEWIGEQATGVGMAEA